jgi:hypothetical protein
VGAGLMAVACAVAAQGTSGGGTDASNSAQTPAAQAAQPAHHRHHMRAHHNAMHRTMQDRDDQASAQGDQAYRRALRACVTQADAARDRCLDSAIEQFGRNT